jgi:hypothetical protein
VLLKGLSVTGMHSRMSYLLCAWHKRICADVLQSAAAIYLYCSTPHNYTSFATGPWRSSNKEEAPVNTCCLYGNLQCANLIIKNGTCLPIVKLTMSTLTVMLFNLHPDLKEATWLLLKNAQYSITKQLIVHSTLSSSSSSCSVHSSCGHRQHSTANVARCCMPSTQLKRWEHAFADSQTCCAHYMLATHCPRLMLYLQYQIREQPVHSWFVCCQAMMVRESVPPQVGN